MKRPDSLPGMGLTFLLGENRMLFPSLLSGIPTVVSLDEEERPQTVFLGEKDGHKGRESLKECISRNVPFVVLGKGWPRDVPAFLRNLALREGTRIIGPGAGGLVTPFLSGDSRGSAALFAEGSVLFRRTLEESGRRSIPLRYAFSFGGKSDLSPFEAAWAILERDPETLFFTFILDRIRKGREFLEFASEASRNGRCVALLEYDPQPGEDRVEEAALRQFGIVLLREPSQIVDGAAVFLAAGGRGHRGIFPDAGHGELARLLRSEAARRDVLLLDEDDGKSPVLRILRNGTRPSSGGEKNLVNRPLLLTSPLSLPEEAHAPGEQGGPFIPGIGRCLDALALAFAPAETRSQETEGSVSLPWCTLHPRPTEYEAKVLLAAFGIPVARESLCRSFREAAEAAEAIGYPVALKVMSPNILHKTEARVVALNLQDREELRNAYGRTLEKARVADPKARIRGVLVQEMIRGGTEWRMEFRRDPRFGPVVETGISGIYTEILPDGVIRVAPFDEEEARKMIIESRGYPLLLEGWRRERLDIEAFASALSSFSRLAFCEREVSRIDVNPLFVNRKGVLVVDAFIEKRGKKR
jgi:hypothetical protein